MRVYRLGETPLSAEICVEALIPVSVRITRKELKKLLGAGGAPVPRQVSFAGVPVPLVSDPVFGDTSRFSRVFGSINDISVGVDIAPWAKGIFNSDPMGFLRHRFLTSHLQYYPVIVKSMLGTDFLRIDYHHYLPKIPQWALVLQSQEQSVLLVRNSDVFITVPGTTVTLEEAVDLLLDAKSLSVPRRPVPPQPLRLSPVIPGNYRWAPPAVFQTPPEDATLQCPVSGVALTYVGGPATVPPVQEGAALEERLTIAVHTTRGRSARVGVYDSRVAAVPSRIASKKVVGAILLSSPLDLDSPCSAPPIYIGEW